MYKVWWRMKNGGCCVFNTKFMSRFELIWWQNDEKEENKSLSSWQKYISFTYTIHHIEIVAFIQEEK